MEGLVIVVNDKLLGRGVKQINHGVQFSGKQCER